MAIRNGDNFISEAFRENCAFGDDGDDALEGELGNDELWGGRGADALVGGEGDDFLVVGAGADALEGGLGGYDIASYEDWLSGFASGSVGGLTINMADPGLSTGDARDDSYLDIEAVRGTIHNDIIVGDALDNVLVGGLGDDILRGGDGRDLLLGDEGGDVLNGGKGNDKLWGGAGKDVFVFKIKGDKDTVKDFGFGKDRLKLDDKLFGNLTAEQVVSRYADEKGRDIVFDFGSGDKLVLEDYGDIDSLADFIDII